LARSAAPGIEERVVRLAATQPEWGQFSVARALREEGLQISPSGVRSIWQRHGLQTLYQRVQAIAATGRPRPAALDERQRAHLERIRRRRQLGKAASASASTGLPYGRRELLLTVAADQFSRHGYRGAALKVIAEHAGILPGSMYHYFKSKQDLFEQVHHAAFQELTARVDAALARSADPVERLRAACRAHLQLLLSGSALSGFARIRLFTPPGSALNARMMRDRRAYEARFAGLVDAVAPPGSDRTLLRLGLLGAINWTQVWYRPGRLTPDAIADELVRMFLGPGAAGAAAAPPRAAAPAARRGTGPARSPR